MARVLVANTPALRGVNGPDDFIAARGDDEMISLLAHASPLEHTRSTPGPTKATRLVALSEDATLFHTPDGRPYATVVVERHEETWPVRSIHFREWLVRRFYQAENSAPSGQALNDALAVISAKAQFDGGEFPVFIRVAECRGNIYLDLGDPAWRAVEVTATGWNVVDKPPVRFRRSAGMLALPLPEHGGSISELRPFVNVQESDWVIYVSWLVAALRPKGPYPILGLHGEQGNAKTTTSKVARLLVDPYKAAMRTKSRDERDLMITASHSHIVTLDNLSNLEPWLSDALCRLATGGGLATRQLYEDEDEIIFDVQRPILLNGIHDVATRGDLLDRMSVLSCPVIEESNRRDEREFWASFEAIRPRILGALLDGVATALANLDSVKLAGKPRMADFAIWASAAEVGLGFEAGTFMRAYLGNRKESSETALESSPVGPEVRVFMQSKDLWEGTAGELLQELEAAVGEGYGRRRNWPQSPKALSNALVRLAPALRSAGVTFSRLPREAGTGRRILRLENPYTVPSQPSRLPQPHPSQEVGRDDGRNCDAGRDARPDGVGRTNAVDSTDYDGVTMCDDGKHPLSEEGHRDKRTEPAAMVGSRSSKRLGVTEKTVREEF